MSYADIVMLVRQDECSKIIHALRKTPGLVCYKGGVIRYTSIGRNKYFRFFDKWANTLGVWFFGVILITSITLLVFGKGESSVAGFVFTLFSSVMLGLQLRERAHDQMVNNLVED